MAFDGAAAFRRQPHPQPVSAEARAAILADPGFGRAFTDHMATVRYRAGEGWCEPAVQPRAPIALDPAAAVFHYAQEVFEGLKVYRTESGAPALFRPEANAERMRASARRMAMPEPPDAIFLGSIQALVEVDHAWIPEAPKSLYIRPFMIATEAALGVKPSSEYLFAVIASPVGAYFKGAAAPVTVWASTTYTRAAPGGTGAVKCGANYAASLLAQAEAQAHGCEQVVFLDAVERRWVEELGGMNLFFVFEDGRLLTPPLGTILPGVTRDCVIALARGMGLEVSEAPYAIDSWRADAGSGRLREVFACGTAAVITPVGRVRSEEGEFEVAGGEVGDVTRRLLNALTNIQRGTSPDPFGWRRVLDVSGAPGLTRKHGLSFC